MKKEKPSKYLEIPLQNYHIIISMVQERNFSILEKSLIYIINKNKKMESILKEFEIDSKIILQTLIDLLYKRIINISFETNSVELRDEIKERVRNNTLNELFHEIPIESKHINIYYDICGNLFDKNNQDIVNLVSKPQGEDIEIYRLKYTDEILAPKIHELSWVHFIPFIWIYKKGSFRINEIQYIEYINQSNYLYFPIDDNNKSYYSSIKPTIVRNWLNTYYKQENLEPRLHKAIREEKNLDNLREQILNDILLFQGTRDVSKFQEIFGYLSVLSGMLSKSSRISIENHNLYGIIKSKISEISHFMILVLPQIEDVQEILDLILSLGDLSEKKIYILFSKMTYENNITKIRENVQNNLIILKLKKVFYTNYIVIDGNELFYPLINSLNPIDSINQEISFIRIKSGVIPLTIASLIFSQVTNYPKNEYKQLNSLLSKIKSFNPYSTRTNIIDKYQNNVRSILKLSKKNIKEINYFKDIDKWNIELIDMLKEIREINEIELFLSNDYESQIFHLLNKIEESKKINISIDLIDPIFAKNFLDLFRLFSNKMEIEFIGSGTERGSIYNFLNQRTISLFKKNNIVYQIANQTTIHAITFSFNDDMVIISQFSPFVSKREEYKFRGYLDFGFVIKSLKFKKEFEEKIRNFDNSF